MRTFLPKDLSIKNWAQIETYFDDLNTRAIDSVEDLKKKVTGIGVSVSKFQFHRREIVVCGRGSIACCVATCACDERLMWFRDR